MIITKFHTVILFCTVWNFAICQPYTHYSTNDGLPSNHVYRITQDYDGFIWAITDKGMVKFDGTEFKIFNTSDNLPINDIWDIRVTPNNKIWFFSKAQKIGFVQNDSVVAYSRENSEKVIFPAYIAQNKNTIALRYADELLYQNEDGKWESINATTGQNGNRIFYVHPSQSLAISDTKRSDLEDITEDFNVQSDFFAKRAGEFENYRAVIKDRKCYWYYDEGWGVLDLITGEIYHAKFDHEVVREFTNFTRFHFVNDEVQLTGTEFVAKLDSGNSIKEMVRIHPDLGSHFSMIDRSGNVWIATFQNGIYKLPVERRDNTYDLENKIIQSMMAVDNRIIAGVYDEGFYLFDENEGKFKSIIQEEGFVYGVYQIEELKKRFYIFGDKILVEDIESGRFVHRINSNTWGRKMAYLNDTIYTSLSPGLNKINPVTFEVLERVREAGINDLTVFGDKLLLATSSGLKQLHKGKIVPVEGQTDYEKLPIIEINVVNDSLFIIGTDGFGAYLSDGEKTTKLEHSEFLSVQTTYIEANNIWLGTNEGVYHYSGTDSNYSFVEKIGDRHGLINKNVIAIVGRGDNLLIASNNQTALIPKNRKPYQQILDLYLSEIKYNGTLLTNEHSTRYTKDGNINISIGRIDFSSSSEPADFSFKLDPLHDSWTTSNSGNLTFSDLQPNSYELRIRAGEVSKTINFEITPLWWQRTVSKVVFAFLILAVASTLILWQRRNELAKKTRKLRTEKKLAEFELYALRSQMNPHFVFNSLTAIQYYINNNELEKSEKYLVKFSKLIRQFLDLSRKDEIILEDEVALLSNYLDIEQLRFKEKLDYKIVVDPRINAKNTRIPSMLLQPTVENAVNHGIFNKEEDGEITITFSAKAHDAIQVEILDNGVGYARTSTKRNGELRSGDILKDKLFHLNRSGNWKVDYSLNPAFPDEKDKGTLAIFSILKLK